MSGFSRVSCSSFREEVYLTRQKICRNCNIVLLYELPEEPHRSDITTNCFKNRVENTADSDEGVNDKRNKTIKYHGVDELITSFKYHDRTYEVQEIHQTLKTICGSLHFSELSKESDDSIETSSKPSQAHSGVYQTSPKKKKVVNDSDTKMVTVKVTYKDDMIKFQLPFSSGVLELKNQVAQRLNLKSTRIRLKYVDENHDLILVSSDADFHNLMPFSASSVGKNTIKLIVEMADD